MNDKYRNDCFVGYPFEDYNDWLFEQTLRIIEENEIENIQELSDKSSKERFPFWRARTIRCALFTPIPGTRKIVS